MGRYSSLEITWVGTGRWRSSHASRSDLRIHPLWTCGFEQDGTVFGLGIFTTGTTANFIGQRLLLHDSVYNCHAPFAPDGFFVNLNGGSVEEIVNAKEGGTRKFRCQADQYALC